MIKSLKELGQLIADSKNTGGDYVYYPNKNGSISGTTIDEMDIFVLAENIDEVGQITIVCDTENQFHRFDFRNEKKTSLIKDADPVDKYVSMMERQIQFILDQQSKNEERLDKRLRLLVSQQKEENNMPSPQLDLQGILGQLAPLIELAKNSGVLNVK